MQSMPTLILGGVLFVAALVLAYALDFVFGPTAVLLLSIIVIAIGLYLHRDWLTYAGGLVICAGLTYDVVLDTVQTGSIAGGLFAIVMLGAVAVCSVISADKLKLGV
jgi:lipopolysaccharide export LptBFGC system permease protein LptF